MIRQNADPSIKKTLVRNCEQKVAEPRQNDVVFDIATRLTKSATEASRRSQPSRSCQKENDLGYPTLCSTKTIANYLSEVASRGPPLSLSESVNVNNDQQKMSAKITKKLNFHLNDRMYKDLVKLNASAEDQKITKKEKRPLSTSLKRDAEPKIEDFNQNPKEADTPPTIPIPKLKSKPIRHVNYGHLHKLVSSLEDL